MCPRPLSWPASFQGALAARPSKARFTVNFLRVDYLPLLSVTAFFTFIPVNCSRASYYFISSAHFHASSAESPLATHKAHGSPRHSVSSFFGPSPDNDLHIAEQLIDYCCCDCYLVRLLYVEEINLAARLPIPPPGILFIVYPVSPSISSIFSWGMCIFGLNTIYQKDGYTDND